MTNQRARIAKLEEAIDRSDKSNDMWVRVVGCWFEQNIFEHLDETGPVSEYRPGGPKYNALVAWYENEKQLAARGKGITDAEL
jgi:hypothetical protein